MATMVEADNKRKARRNLIILGVLILLLVAWWVYQAEPFRGRETDLTAPRSAAQWAVRCAEVYFQNQLGDKGHSTFVADDKKTEPKGDAFTLHGNVTWTYVYSPTRTMNDSGPAEVTIKVSGDQFEASGARVKGQAKFPGTEQALKDAKLPKPAR